MLISVDQVFRAAQELVSAQLLKRRLQLEVDCPAMTSRILANQTDFQQVLINLLLNGADASPEGAKLLLFAREAGATIELGVRDWGTGISEDAEKHLYDPFFTTKDAGLGTGLGLSVCPHLVDRHNGQIYYRTAAGQGTTVTLRFPARSPEGETTALKF